MRAAYARNSSLEARFCSRCGSALDSRPIEGRRRAVCSACGRIAYDQLKVGAGALIEREGRLLLVRRAHEPFKARWNIPAGYVEADEAPAQATIREVREETGLRVAVDQLADVYFFDDDPRGNGILIVYRCRVIGGTLTASTEATNPTFFTRDGLPAELAGGGHDRAIRAWQRGS